MTDSVEIINTGSGVRKICAFAGFLGRGGWLQVRYPGGAGLWAFSLRHGLMEAKRGEHAKWQLNPEHLERLRANARLEGVKFSTQTKCAARKNRPKFPAQSVAQRQIELWER